MSGPHGVFMPMTDLETLLAAVLFACEKHRLQKRKDGLTPYINHPIAVAERLARVGGVTDLPTLLAAVLHDTVEDTETQEAELSEHFGPEVASIVAEVTDDKSLPKAARKQLQIEHAAQLTSKAKLVKLADKISNIRDMTPAQPTGWPLERKLEYLDWAERVVAGLRGTNSALEDEFDAVLADRRIALGVPAGKH
jgi:guanosine-3',5'-bis(diphosphate) 3'-pyrophosphohydrolase